ncbi:MAG: FHA domain-containing protein [Deltaproteobacteria bacterium]|nr:FHA domain-containing protein [Deltaproteobacteria bacterium]
MNDGAASDNDKEQGVDDSATVVDGGAREGPPRIARLVGLSGAVSGETWLVPDDGGIIGRSKGAEICIEDWSVSRRHAEITRCEGGFQIKDIESSNGTKVNGKRVTSAVLSEGDTVRLGRLVFRFEIADGANEFEAKGTGLPGDAAPLRRRSRRKPRRSNDARRAAIAALALGLVMGVALAFVVFSPDASRDAPVIAAPAPAAPAPEEDFNAKAQRSKDERNETTSLGVSAPLRQIPAPAPARARLSPRELTRALAEVEPHARLRTALARYHRGEIDAAITIVKRLAARPLTQPANNRAARTLAHFITVRDAFRRATGSGAPSSAATRALWRTVASADRALLLSVDDSFFRVRATAALSR